MVQADEYPGHNPGCFRQYITNIYPDGPIKLIPSFRKRWDCPGCVARKFWKGLSHLGGTEMQMAWEDNREIRNQASHFKAGYVAISFRDFTKKYVITTPELFPKKAPLQLGDVLQECIQLGLQTTVSRLSHNALWRPVDEKSDVLPIPTFSRNRKEVIKAIINAGFPDMDTDGTPLEAVERRIKIRLNGEDLDLP